ncbi:predicted protein [Lichtheimia corymbifera JMRC:FSU:9682]|uniref:Uncharacterized protein n=1 Tax=Lichtheimia corymbifera JMRC:FSU:9682 TaxID=1263082 RepID=A0A068SI46_9FUNG|nr:predicted protein [Lichtheimia corymbifera JMRC:FSU:9682]
MNQFIPGMSGTHVFQKNRLCESDDTGQQGGVAFLKTTRYKYKGTGANWFCGWQDLDVGVQQGGSLYDNEVDEMILF